MLLKRFNVVGKHKTSLVLHVKCSKCVLRFNQIWILCSVDRASRYNCVNQNQLDAQLIISICRQPLHVSGVSRSSSGGTTLCIQNICTYYSF